MGVQVCSTSGQEGEIRISYKEPVSVCQEPLHALSPVVSEAATLSHG